MPSRTGREPAALGHANVRAAVGFTAAEVVGAALQPLVHALQRRFSRPDNDFVFPLFNLLDSLALGAAVLGALLFSLLGSYRLLRSGRLTRASTLGLCVAAYHALLVAQFGALLLD